MKFSHTYRIFGSLLALTAAWACGLEAGEECPPCKTLRSARLEVAGAAETGLVTPLYLFRRAAGSDADYLFDSAFTSLADGAVLKLPLADLNRFDYRFLMLAQPADDEALALRTAAGTALAEGVAWSDLRLESPTGRAPFESYCGVTEMTGAAILRDGRIGLTLTRVAGQVLFDFFRIDGSLADPVGVLSPDVASVLDRVAQIDIAYEHVTTALRFDASGALTPAAYASQPLTQTLAPRAENFRVPLPQSDLGLGVLDPSLAGSLRMKGACLLPSDAKLRVKTVFTYYDTTPVCGNAHAGDHTADCFPLRQVTLRLPASGAAEGLSVAADCFTVNRAGLRCDRIIDIPVDGGLETDFKWL